MRYLLDTQVLLWAAAAPERLPGDLRELLEDVDHDLYFSVASLWEIALRNELEPDSADLDPRMLRGALLTRDYEELAIVGAHAVAVDLLPPLHSGDPFDRMLVAQAQREGLTLLTANARLAGYPAVHLVSTSAPAVGVGSAD